MRHLYVHGRTQFSTDTAPNAVQHRHSPQRSAAQTQPSTHCTLHRALRCQNSRATARSQQGQQELKAVCECTCFGAVQGNEALSGAGSDVSDTHTHTHIYILSLSEFSHLHTYVILAHALFHLPCLPAPARPPLPYMTVRYVIKKYHPMCVSVCVCVCVSCPAV